MPVFLLSIFLVLSLDSYTLSPTSRCIFSSALCESYNPTNCMARPDSIFVTSWCSWRGKSLIKGLVGRLPWRLPKGFGKWWRLHFPRTQKCKRRMIQITLDRLKDLGPIFWCQFYSVQQSLASRITSLHTHSIFACAHVQYGVVKWWIIWSVYVRLRNIELTKCVPWSVTTHSIVPND